MEDVTSTNRNRARPIGMAQGEEGVEGVVERLNWVTTKTGRNVVTHRSWSKTDACAGFPAELG